MKATELVDLLECEWENFESGLDQDWKIVQQQIQSAVEAIPVDPEEQQLEEAVVKIEELLRRDDYSRGVLDGWSCAQETASSVERRPGSSSQTLRNEEKVKSLCNRLRRLTR